MAETLEYFTSEQYNKFVCNCEKDPQRSINLSEGTITFKCKIDQTKKKSKSKKSNCDYVKKIIYDMKIYSDFQKLIKKFDIDDLENEFSGIDIEDSYSKDKEFEEEYLLSTDIFIRNHLIYFMKKNKEEISPELLKKGNEKLESLDKDLLMHITSKAKVKKFDEKIFDDMINFLKEYTRISSDYLDHIIREDVKQNPNEIFNMLKNIINGLCVKNLVYKEPIKKKTSSKIKFSYDDEFNREYLESSNIFIRNHLIYFMNKYRSNISENLVEKGLEKIKKINEDLVKYINYTSSMLDHTINNDIISKIVIFFDNYTEIKSDHLINIIKDKTRDDYVDFISIIRKLVKKITVESLVYKEPKFFRNSAKSKSSVDYAKLFRSKKKDKFILPKLEIVNDSEKEVQYFTDDEDEIAKESDCSDNDTNSDSEDDDEDDKYFSDENNGGNIGRNLDEDKNSESDCCDDDNECDEECDLYD